MIYSEEEILQYIEENDVKFVKLTFCDGNGGMKNISIPAPGLAQAFAKGIRITAKKIPERARSVPVPRCPDHDAAPVASAGRQGHPHVLLHPLCGRYAV